MGSSHNLLYAWASIFQMGLGRFAVYMGEFWPRSQCESNRKFEPDAPSRFYRLQHPPTHKFQVNPPCTGDFQVRDEFSGVVFPDSFRMNFQIPREELTFAPLASSAEVDHATFAILSPLKK